MTCPADLQGLPEIDLSGTSAAGSSGRRSARVDESAIDTDDLEGNYEIRFTNAYFAQPYGWARGDHSDAARRCANDPECEGFTLIPRYGIYFFAKSQERGGDWPTEWFGSGAVALALVGKRVEVVETTVRECYPAVTEAHAGGDQLNILAYSIDLAANAPADNGSDETGTWEILSGEGGRLADASAPDSRFTVASGENYRLRWTLTNLCGSSYDDVVLNVCDALPTIPNAGQDMQNNVPTATLSANSPTRGVGEWSVVEGGQDITFSDINDPNATVEAEDGYYKLRWRIATDCTQYSDEMWLLQSVSLWCYTTESGREYCHTSLDAIGGQPPRTFLTIPQAESYCNDLEYMGYTDWQIPPVEWMGETISGRDKTIAAMVYADNMPREKSGQYIVYNGIFSNQMRSYTRFWTRGHGGAREATLRFNEHLTSKSSRAWSALCWRQRN